MEKSYIKIIVFFALVLSCLTISSGTRAQLASHWHTTHSDHNGQFRYAFTALSSAGEECTAAGLVIDDSMVGDGPAIRIMFFRSHDGGLTWIEQDPGLPREFGQNQNEISVVQQIDSLNVVAIGDTGLILRTIDGGITWKQQNLNTSRKFLDVHFSDPMTGIVLVQDYPNILTTTDGGEHWSGFSHYKPGDPLTQFCHSYGGGMFRAITYELGQIFTTYDSWQSVDSSLEILDTGRNPRIIGGCNFRSRDTMVAYGIHFTKDSANLLSNPRLLITRSTNGGALWTEISGLDSVLLKPVQMSPLDRDFVLISGLSTGGRNLIGISTDHGMSWEIDSVLRDSNYPPYIARVTVTPQGHAVAIVTQPFRGSTGLLMRADRVESKVKSSKPIISDTQIYPNPATTDLNILSTDLSRPVHLVDVLGHEVLSGVLSVSGQVTLDVSKIPRGVYSVVIDRDGTQVPVGKIAVIGK